MTCVRNLGVELVGELPSADAGTTQGGVPGWKEA